MRITQKWICQLLLLTMCLSLCACSPVPQSSRTARETDKPVQRVEVEVEAPKNVVQRMASTEVRPPEGETISWISSLAKLDGRLYFKTQSTKGCRLFSTDFNGEEMRELIGYNGEPILGFAASDHGTLYVINNLFNENTQLYEFYLQEIDKDGVPRWQKTLSGLLREDFVPTGITSGGDKLFLLSGGSLVVLRIGDEVEKFSALSVDPATMMTVLADGRILLGERDNGQYVLRIFDTETKTLKDAICFDKGNLSLLCGGDCWDVYLNDGTSVYGLDLASGLLEKQFEWLSIGIVGRTLLETPDGGFFVADGDNRLFRMKQIDVEVDESGEPEVMTLVVLDRSYIDRALEEAILEWNREHPECTIVVRDYYPGEHSNDVEKEQRALDEARQSMAVDIISGGTRPDLYDLGGLNTASLAVSGKLENLYPYLDNDPELSRESFYPNVLAAQEICGELYEVVTNYSLLTATGFASELGEARTWDEMMSISSSTDRCERLFTAECRNRMELLKLLIDASGKKLIDWDRGECHFDSLYFISILNATAQLPEQGVDPAEYYVTLRSRADGEGLLTIDEYTDLWRGAGAGRQYGEGNCAVVGFPELGSVLVPYGVQGASALGMAADSTHKEECWAFLRTLYLRSRGSAFSPLRGSLEDMIQEKLNQMIEEGCADSWPNAEADMRLFASAFTEATVLYRHDDAVWAIVKAEAARFYAGECSAEECAEAIQSRARIYISEQCG